MGTFWFIGIDTLNRHHRVIIRRSPFFAIHMDPQNLSHARRRNASQRARFSRLASELAT